MAQLVDACTLEENEIDTWVHAIVVKRSAAVGVGQLRSCL